MKKKFQANAAFFQQQNNDNFVVGGDPPANLQNQHKNNKVSTFGKKDDDGPVQKLSAKGLEGALSKAKQTGTLSLQGKGLDAIPEQLTNFQNISMGEGWWEGCDLTKIDLSANAITQIPEEFVTQEFIEHLNFNGNKLQAVPDALFSLANLKFLDISNNQMMQLPDSIGNAVNLVEFHAAGNGISQLPGSMQQLQNLEILDLKENKLAIISFDIAQLQKLLKINLESNQLKSVKTGFGHLQRLSDLNIGKNKLEFVEDDCLSMLKSIVVLDLHQNQFTSFSSVPKSKKLDQLSLAFNQIEEFSGIENAENLTMLDLHSNKLTKFPQAIVTHNGLRTLKISNNDIQDIDPRIALLPNLVRINIEGNPLKSIKSSMRSAGAEQLKKYLRNRIDENEVQQVEEKQAIIKSGMSNDPFEMLIREFMQGSTLDLRQKDLNKYSPKLWAQTHLQTLDLSNNNYLLELPKEVSMLSNLRTLKMINCGLKDLPFSLLSMSTLVYVELDKNQLTDFLSVNPQGQHTGPHEVKLPYLQYLSLNGNNISRIPQSLKYMPALTNLNLHMNRVKDLKELCRSAFANLTSLDVGQNKLMDCPTALIYYLKNLSMLVLANNDIVQLPNLIGKHDNLKNIQVDGNPLKSVRRFVIEKGSEAILKYLADKYVEGRDDVVEQWALDQDAKDQQVMGQVITQAQVQQVQQTQQAQQQVQEEAKHEESKIGGNVNMGQGFQGNMNSQHDQQLASQQRFQEEQLRLQEEKQREIEQQQILLEQKKQQMLLEEQERQRQEQELLKQQQLQQQQQQQQQAVNRSHPSYSQFGGFGDNSQSQFTQQQQVQNKNHPSFSTFGNPQHQNYSQQPQQQVQSSHTAGQHPSYSQLGNNPGQAAQGGSSGGGQNDAKKAEIDAQIKQIQHDLDNNFSLSSIQIREKKKQINQLRSQKNAL